MNRLLLVYGLVGALALACGGDGRPPTEPEPVVARVDVAPGADTLTALGETRQYSAVARDARGTVISGKAFSWTSSAAGVASIDPATGLVTAVANGDATIRATVDGVTGQAALAVAQQVATVAVTPGTASLTAVGATQQFGAEARDANNNLVAGVAFIWLSSNHNVATVTTAGLATATGPGSATITAAGRGIPGSAALGVAQTATQLAFSIDPTDAVAGAAISPAVQVEIRDANGVLVASARDPVTVAIQAGPGDGTLAGTKVVSAVGGIATFSGLWIDKAGSNYTLGASSGSLASATSASFAVSPTAASRFRFTDLPALVELDRVVAPAVTVTILDAFDNLVPTGTVALAIGINPGGAVLSGTLAAAAVNGVATFADLRLDRTGLGYTLVAGMGAATGESAFFDVFAWTAVSAGARHTCGVISPGDAAFCWGDNALGQLGNGTTTSSTKPVRVSGGFRFKALSAGSGHTCGVTETRFAYCWGDGGFGQLGNGKTTSSTTPVLVSGGLPFVTVSAGGSHSCGVTLGEEAYCWGANASGQLGNGSHAVSAVPVLVKVKHPVSGVALGVRAVSAGGSHTCGLATGEAQVKGAYCWGDNSSGQLGDGTTTSNTAPEPVRDLSGLSVAFSLHAISAGGKHTCGLYGGDSRVAAGAYCWGGNDDGQLGNGTTTSGTTPVLVSGGLPFMTVSAGGNHTCGVTLGEEAHCWGGNGEGQLGGGTTTGSAIPRLVLNPADKSALLLAAVSAGTKHTCGITRGGALYCWGANAGGQLGDGTQLNRGSPVRVARP